MKAGFHRSYVLKQIIFFDLLAAIFRVIYLWVFFHLDRWLRMMCCIRAFCSGELNHLCDFGRGYKCMTSSISLKLVWILTSSQSKSVMRNINMALIWLWNSSSIWYLFLRYFLFTLWRPFCLVEQNDLCRLIEGNMRNIYLEILWIWTSGSRNVVQRYFSF